MITYLFDRSSPETGPCTTEGIGGKKIGWEEDESWETKSLILDKLPVERLIYSDKAIQTWGLFNHKVECFAVLKSSDSKNKIKLVRAAIHLRHQNSLRDSFIHSFLLVNPNLHFYFFAAHKQQRLV